MQSIEQWWIDTYRDNVIHELQQKESLLSGTVRKVDIKGEKRRLSYSAWSKFEENDGYWSDTKISFQERWVFAKKFYSSFPIDDEYDIERSFTDPTSSQVLDCVHAANRCKDKIIIEALTANAVTGRDATELSAFPTSNIVDIQLGTPTSALANTGLNLEKLKYTKYLFDKSNVDKKDKRFFILGAWQVQELLNNTEITSSDYNSVKALVAGEIDTFLGFKFIQLSDEILPHSNNIRDCYAYSEQSVGLGLCKDMSIKSGEVPLKNFNMLVQAQLKLGAVRIHDAGVYKIPCKEEV